MKSAAILLCFGLAAFADNRPEFSSKDVVRSADRSAGGIAPGEIVTLFVSNAGPDVLAEAKRNAAGQVATELGDTRVWFDDIAAPLVYSVKGEVSAVVPYELAGKSTTQIVVEYRGVRSSPVTLPVIGSAPALFTLDSSGRGQAAMLNETGCCNSARNPAPRGSVAVLYATGEGQTKPAGKTGFISSYSRFDQYPVPRDKVRVLLGGVSAEILYAGAAPHAVSGLLQVNFRVPAKAPLGDAVPLQLLIGGVASPQGLTMAVRSPVQRILLMDESNRLRRMLSGAGYEVMVARTPFEARVKAHENPIDLVITSLAMQSEEIAFMRVAHPQLKIIATARSMDPETLRIADLLNSQAMLTDTMTTGSILQRVQNILRRRPATYVAVQGPSALTRATPR
jgi:uncharacterized protein (TIGR03437 family)